MVEWIKKNIKLPKFIKDFLGALNNNPGSQSLRKLLAVGFFWLTAALCIRYTDRDNLVMIVGILTAMITTLVVTYSVSNIQEQKLAKKSDFPKSDEPEI